MENLFYADIPTEFKSVFVGDNLALFKEAQPDTYDAMESLANITGLPIEQTCAVNAIVEISTYCTSILAKTLDNDIVHVRNLDFGHRPVMQKLVHY